MKRNERRPLQKVAEDNRREKMDKSRALNGTESQSHLPFEVSKNLLEVPADLSLSSYGASEHVLQLVSTCVC